MQERTDFFDFCWVWVWTKITWLTHDWHLTDTWLTQDWHMTDTSLIDGWHRTDTWHLTDTWLIHDWHMTDTWLTPDWHMTDTWLTHDWHRTDTWLTHDWHMTDTYWHMTDTWLTHDWHMTDTCRAQKVQKWNRSGLWCNKSVLTITFFTNSDSLSESKFWSDKFKNLIWHVYLSVTADSAIFIIFPPRHPTFTIINLWIWARNNTPQYYISENQHNLPVSKSYKLVGGVSATFNQLFIAQILGTR